MSILDEHHNQDVYLRFKVVANLDLVLVMMKFKQRNHLDDIQDPIQFYINHPKKIDERNPKPIHRLRIAIEVIYRRQINIEWIDIEEKH